MAYDVHQVVTDKIIAAIERGGLAPWHKSWSASAAPGAASVASPANALTGRAYSGINVLTLWSAAMAHGYASGAWVSLKQAESMGGSLKKGMGKLYEPVVWCSRRTFTEDRSGAPIVNDDGTPGERSVFLTKYSFVYNVAAFDGLSPGAAPVAGPSIPGHAGVAAIVAGLGVPLHHGGDRAFYRSSLLSTDEAIHMPHVAAFATPDAYHATLLHELSHATGHKSRLSRDLSGSFGSAKYAAEELVAELGAAFACAFLGIDSEPRADHASYIDHWMKAMKADKRAIFTAASKASAAAKYLYNAGGVSAVQSPEEEQAAAK
jgi:antirestriction protein ArdC